MTYAANYSSYRNNLVLDANQGKLILMMYDGAIQFVTQAIDKLEDNDLGGMGLYLGKAESVVSELLNSLNFSEGGEISKSLENIYAFILKELLLANIKKDPKILKQMISMLSSLREAWHKIFAKEEITISSPEEAGEGIRCRL